MKSKKKYQVSTLGCRTNQYESEGYAKQLREMGFIEAKSVFTNSFGRKILPFSPRFFGSNSAE